MSKFCDKCGSLMNDNDNVCAVCGTPFQNQDYHSRPMPVNNKPTKNTKKFFVPLIVVCVVCVMLVPALVLPAIFNRDDSETNSSDNEETVYSYVEMPTEKEKVDFSAVSDGDIVEFGSYPQSEVDDAGLLAALNSLNLNWVSYEYYLGSGSRWDGQMAPSDFMRYTDVVYMGKKYRAVIFDMNRPNYSGQLHDEDSCQKANGYNPNTIYWFEYEPLKWRVLDSETGLIFCETVIDSQPFHNYMYETSNLGRNARYWGDSQKQYEANDYPNSSIRGWLNDDFYNIAFSAEEKNQIAVTELNNDCIQVMAGYSRDVYKDDNCEPTNDKIFLLSYADIINEKYGFPVPEPRRAKPSEYAMCQGVGCDEEYEGCSVYWLRSPDADEVAVCYVSSSGFVTSRTAKYASPINTGSNFWGVRPALQIIK